MDIEKEILCIEKVCGCEFGSIGLLAVIEFLLGIICVVEIVYVFECLIGIVFGVEDYVCNLCIECFLEGIELLFVCCFIL